MDLVEREPALRTLRARLQSAGERGHVALVAGEAGIGKTSVLRALAVTHTPVWWGACDALQTPHPLAPLLDIARESGVRFASRLAGPRPALFEAVLDELRLAPAPVLVVIEDAHWADDATLDLLKFLGRRIERTHALLAVSFRDDEVPASHPLRRVLGELPPAAITRVDLPRLSPQAVETLARRADRSAAGVHAATGGNPFFVTELLRERGEAVPRTVQDLVLARYARLPTPAQELVRLVSVVPGRAERWLADALLSPAVADIEACIDRGLLLADGATLSFRHELARAAVESSLAPPVAQALHARVLAALIAPGHDASPARLVHHAAGARDTAAVSRYAPMAAEQARSRGAHREAAAQWRRALRNGAPEDEAQRQSWLEAYAVECQWIDRQDEAIAAREQLNASLQGAGDTVGQAHNLSRLAILHAFMMRYARADEMSRRAIDMLEPLPPGPELAAAYGVRASLRMFARDCAESVEWGRKAIALAREFGNRRRLCASLSTVGTAMMFLDYEAGSRQVQEALQMALADGNALAAANAMQDLGAVSGELMRLRAAEHWLRRAEAYARECEQDDIRHYALAWLSRCELHTGRWDDAGQHANDVVARPGISASNRVTALITLGRLRVRRGDAGADTALDEALALALAAPADTLQRIAPIRAARAEAAFTRGDPDSAAAEAGAVLPLALRHRHPWFIGELSYWCWRAGALNEIPPACAEPYALQIAGRWSEAAAAWDALGCPYERAQALADGDTAAQQQALEFFDQLGARPAADELRRRLRRAGVRGLARGARPSTRESPFGLTKRELDVLRLLCAGLRNAEIAHKLHRSVRTVDHHLESVFAKLGVATRVEAIQTAQRAGLCQSGQSGPPN